MAERPPKIELIPKAAVEDRAPIVSEGFSSLPPESEAAMRMPSAVMRVDLPGESSAVVPAFAQRRPYAPPKMSAPIPGKVKMIEPASPMIVQWLASVVRALRGMQMYADNNTRRKDFVDQSFSVLEDIFAKATRIDLVITEDQIAYGRDLVHYNPEPFESLPRILYDGSVRKLTLTRGLTALELVRFLGVISTDFSRPENFNDDLVAMLARMNLPHVRAKGPDAPAAVAPKYVPPPEPDPPPPPPPARLSSAHFEPIQDPFGEDDEATVLAQPPPSVPPDDEATVTVQKVQKKQPADIASLDDEATLQEGMLSPKIDVSDLLDDK